MKLSIRTAELARALYRVQGIADRKSTMPVYAHVLLDASEEQGLTVSATDYDVGLAGSYAAEVSKPGRFAVHARQLYDIVKALASETLEIEAQETQSLELRAGSSRFRLVGMPPDDFPALPTHTQGKSFIVPAAELAEMIDRTIFCVSTDDNRHNLSGVYCQVPEPHLLRMVATDGHRLALVEKKFDSDVAIEHGVVVPRKGFQELKRVLADTSAPVDKVELGFSRTSGVMKAGSVVLSTRLVEGQFPDYQQVIPKSATKKAKINRVALADALRRVSVLSQGRAYGVRLGFGESGLELTAEDPKFGEAHENVPLEFTGQPITIGYNARYLLDVLALIHDEAIQFEISDELSPGVMRPLEEPGFLAVVMPMRI